MDNFLKPGCCSGPDYKWTQYQLKNSALQVQEVAHQSKLWVSALIAEMLRYSMCPCPTKPAMDFPPTNSFLMSLKMRSISTFESLCLVQGVALRHVTL